METRGEWKYARCPHCGHKYEFRHCYEDGIDWLGHHRGSGSAWTETSNGCEHSDNLESHDCITEDEYYAETTNKNQEDNKMNIETNLVFTSKQREGMYKASKGLLAQIMQYDLGEQLLLDVSYLIQLLGRGRDCGPSKKTAEMYSKLKADVNQRMSHRSGNQVEIDAMANITNDGLEYVTMHKGFGPLSKGSRYEFIKDEGTHILVYSDSRQPMLVHKGLVQEYLDQVEVKYQNGHIFFSIDHKMYMEVVDFEFMATGIIRYKCIGENTGKYNIQESYIDNECTDPKFFDPLEILEDGFRLYVACVSNKYIANKHKDIFKSVGAGVNEIRVKPSELSGHINIYVKWKNQLA